MNENPPTVLLSTIDVRIAGVPNASLRIVPNPDMASEIASGHYATPGNAILLVDGHVVASIAIEAMLLGMAVLQIVGPMTAKGKLTGAPGVPYSLLINDATFPIDRAEAERLLKTGIFEGYDDKDDA